MYQKNSHLESGKIRFCNEIRSLYDILLKGFDNIARSFLKTREEKIAEQVADLSLFQSCLWVSEMI